MFSLQITMHVYMHRQHAALILILYRPGEY